MSVWTDDLRFAQQSERAVELRLYSGDQLLAGVVEVDEEQNLVTLHTPQAMRDATTRRVRIDDIESLSVTDVEWRQP